MDFITKAPGGNAKVRAFNRRLSLLLMILISGGLMIFPRIPILVVACILGLSVSNFRFVTFNRMSRVWLILLVILVVTVFRPGPVDYLSLTIRYANFIAALILLNAYLFSSQESLQKDLFTILQWFAIQAILTFILANSIGFIFSTIQIYETNYKTIFLIFNYHELIEGITLKRPDGFFFEPGVFQIYLNLYFYLAFVVYRRPGQSILALAAVFSTQSTTSVLICSCILLSEIFRRLASGGIRKKILILCVSAILLPPLFYVGYMNVNEKIFGDLQGSSLAREYDLYTGLNIVRQYPVLGIGFDHARYLELAERNPFADSQLSVLGMKDRATTNGLIYLLYSLGIPLAGIFIFGLFRQQLFSNRILIGLLFGLSLFSEAIIFTPFFLMFIFSAFIIKSRVTISPNSDELRS